MPQQLSQLSPHQLQQLTPQQRQYIAQQLQQVIQRHTVASSQLLFHIPCQRCILDLRLALQNLPSCEATVHSALSRSVPT